MNIGCNEIFYVLDDRGNLRWTKNYQPNVSFSVIFEAMACSTIMSLALMLVVLTICPLIFDWFGLFTHIFC
ncbi:MAG: hypothetical protein ACI9LE_001272 [Paraglaciecola sp.]|jgi:hypothetical protein